MSDRRKRVNLSLVHLTLVLIGTLAIISGLSNEGIFFQIAVSGPILILCIGLLLVIFTVESRHHPSQKIDSLVNSSTNQDIQQTHLLISAMLFLSSVLLMMFSTIALSNQFYSSFSISALFSLCLLGLLFGRIFGSNVGDTSTEGNWPQLSEIDKGAEYAALWRWLKFDWNNEVSNLQQQKIEQQKHKFVQQMKSILADEQEFTALITALEGAYQTEPSDIESILFEQTMRKAYTPWLSGAQNSAIRQKDFDVMNTLTALLLLPTVIELLSHLGKGGNGSAELFNRLLNLVGKYTNRLNCNDLLDLESNVSAISAIDDSELDIELQEFIRLVALYASQNPHYDFSPWWLINLRSRMRVEMASALWGEVGSDVRKNTLVKDIENDYIDWCYQLSQFDSMLDLSMSGFSPKFSSIISKANNSESIVSISSIVQLTWLAHLKLR